MPRVYPNNIQPHSAENPAQLEIIGRVPDRFKEYKPSLFLKRFFHDDEFFRNHTLRNNFLRAGVVGVVSGIIGVIVPPVAFVTGPLLLGCCTAMAGIGIYAVNKTRKKYNERVMNFGVNERFGLNEECVTQTYFRGDDRLNIFDKAFVEALPVNATVDMAVDKLNELFNSPRKGRNFFGYVAKHFFPNSRSREEKLWDSVNDLMKSDLSYKNGNYIDIVPDPKAIQFHAYNHLMGYLQNLAMNFDPPARVPNSINPEWIKEMKERHRNYTNKFLHYVEESEGINSQDPDLPERSLRRIDHFINSGDYRPYPNEDDMDVVSLAQENEEEDRANVNIPSTRINPIGQIQTIPPRDNQI